MRIHQFMIVGLLSAALAAPAAAQSIKKVESSVHHALKTAGNDAKADAAKAGSAAHHTLQTAGNDTKTTLGNATGVHKVGGTVGQAAGDVSRSMKHAGRKAKHSLKKNSSAAHHELKQDGNDAKARVKNP
jgi:hypothetical protein